MYLRGLLGPSERKSLQPMAACLGLSGHDQLQHFIASPAWDDGPLWTGAGRAGRPAGGRAAGGASDRRDGAAEEGDALGRGGAAVLWVLGKRANCQALVSLTLAGREVPAPVGLRLFLPEEWTAEPERCTAAGVPEAEIVAEQRRNRAGRAGPAAWPPACGSADELAV